MYWTLVDNWEWAFAYELKFGLFEFNPSDGDPAKRRLKDGAEVTAMTLPTVTSPGTFQVMQGAALHALLLPCCIAGLLKSGLSPVVATAGPQASTLVESAAAWHKLKSFLPELGHLTSSPGHSASMHPRRLCHNKFLHWLEQLHQCMFCCLGFRLPCCWGFYCIIYYEWLARYTKCCGHHCRVHAVAVLYIGCATYLPISLSLGRPRSIPQQSRRP